MQASGWQGKSVVNEQSFHHRVEQILAQITDIPQDQVDKWIHETCGDDPAVETEIRSLLEHQFVSSTISLRNSSVVNLESNFDSDGIQGLPQIDGFTVKKLIGEGSFGIVYAARQHLPDRDVALKVLKSPCLTRHALDRAQIESHLLARLDHPHIAKLQAIEFIQAGAIHIPYLVMDLVEGRVLSDALLEPELCPKDALIWLAQVCRAVAHAHQAGIVHRDIKPANILISDKPDVGVKLIDFGVGKLVDGSALPLEVQTSAMSFVGTQKYMSPERIRDPRLSATLMSDVYSVGVVAKDITKHSSIKGICDIHLNQLIDHLTSSQPSSRPTDLCNVARRLENISRHSGRLLAISENQSRAVLVVIILLCSFVTLFFTIAKGSPDYDYNTTLQTKVPLSYRDHRTRIQSNDVIDRITSAAPYGSGMPGDPDYDAILSDLTVIDAMMRDGDFASAMERMKKFEMKIQSAQKVSSRINRLHYTTKARCLIGLDDFEQARILCHQAQEEFPLSDNPSDLEIQEWLGLAHTTQSAQNRQSAEDMYLSILKHPRFEFFEWQQQVRVLQFYSGLLWLNNQYNEAEAHFRRAIQYEPKNLDVLSVPELSTFAGCYSSLGLVLLAQSKFDEAEIVMTIAVNRIARYRSPTNVDLCRLQRNLASCYLLSGQFEEAKDRASHLYLIWQNSPDTRWNELASTLLILGSAEAELGNLDVAKIYLEEGLYLVESRVGKSARRHKALIQSTLGLIMSLNGQNKEARVLINNSHEVIIDEYALLHPWRLLSTKRLQNVNNDPTPSYSSNENRLNFRISPLTCPPISSPFFMRVFS